MLVDFHVHSTSSDGTCSPSSIADLARQERCKAVALTDHDTVSGLLSFSSAASARGDNGFLAVQGLELSIEPGEGFDRFHLLALGIDGGNGDLLSFLKRVREGRTVRNRMMIENFLRKGIDLEEELSVYAGSDLLARPHFARYLVDHGLARNVSEAFSLYLLESSPEATRCYAPRERPSREEAFDVVHRAGGICVMAHPKYWKNAWKVAGCDFDEAEKRLAYLKGEGLDALECLYGANTPGEDVAFTAIAERLGLVKTAGSDFHGDNKPANGFGMEVSEDFIRPLLERLS